MNPEDFSKKKALLIEDMAEARIMQKKMLTDFGFKSIDIAMKAETAIELLKSHKYDIILSDYNLGKGKDGQQLLEEVRYSHLIKNTSTYLMVTAETSIEMVMGAIEYQPDGYITKPFSQATLQRRLSKLIAMKDKLRDVNVALDAKDYAKAIVEANKVATNHPSLASKCGRIIGDCLLTLERYKEALSVFDSHLKERKMPWALFGKAKANYYLERLDKAESGFRQLMLDNKFFVNSYDWLAKTLVKRGDLEEAQSVLVDAVMRSPKNLLRQIELGKLSMTVDDSTTAEMSFRRAVFLAKNSCFNDADVYVDHLRSIVAIAEAGEFTPRQRDNFNATLKKIHQQFFEDPTVRAHTYQSEVSLYNANGDEKTAKQLLEMWRHEAESGMASEPDNEFKQKFSNLF
ncbi:response regulator [Marinomonas mediterranea]|jgi:FOG: CheY-like receiver|uniref:Response regulator receiver n=1 Tax=Marinomonas mediterranea (strain ATCC 700492 / JCM 21426 / NBRC 103028 / MMB-1) TaxID=717774 RepID=F2K3D5_MARM1|nr:response regulator [Marinomonas mediterranea]ADZ91277.1 response regulator receiver [Marinomonas mediterranea MMB-1]WCN13330.1 response regulator [Marinomonas mediterranea]WCN17398.1 response regulator [Marinomonas mediterranea MMB-1]